MTLDSVFWQAVLQIITDKWDFKLEMKSAGHFKTKSLNSCFYFYNFYLWGCYPDTTMLVDARKTPSYLLTRGAVLLEQEC